MDSTALLERRPRARRSAIRTMANMISMIGVLIALSLSTSVAVAARGGVPDTSSTTPEGHLVEPVYDSTTIAQEDDGEDRFDEGDDEFGGSGADDEGRDEDGEDGRDTTPSSDDDYDLDDGDGDGDEAGCRYYDDGEDRCLDTCAAASDDGEDHLDAGDDEFQGSRSCVGTTEAIVGGSLDQLGASPATERADSNDLTVPLIALGAAGLGMGAVAFARRRRPIG